MLANVLNIANKNVFDSVSEIHIVTFRTCLLTQIDIFSITSDHNIKCFLVIRMEFNDQI